jgi:hypothetical protein
MAKPECKNLTARTDLALLSIGYWGKHIMPVAAAAEAMRIMIESGAVAMETHSANKTFYYPKKLEVKIETVNEIFIADVPLKNTEAKDAYFAWLKTKAELVGKNYTPEPYSEYLKTKENES